MLMNSFKQILKWTLICLLSFTTFNLFISGRIESSIEIEAPIDLVYLNVADLKKWSAWNENDTTITTNYSGELSGLGAKMSWSGADGVGSLEIIEANFSKSLKNELTFEGADPSYSVWTFEKTDMGTSVSCRFQDELPFYVHLMQLFITAELEDRLLSLKKLCEL